MYRKIVGGEVTMMIVTYVDDIMAAGPEDECDALYSSLSRKLPMTDMGSCTWYDGCAIVQDREKGITSISQQAFAASLVHKFGVEETSDLPASTSSSEDLGPKREDEPGGNWPMREAVGGLLWLSAFTRPDLANSVRMVVPQRHPVVWYHVQEGGWLVSGGVCRFKLRRQGHGQEVGDRYCSDLGRDGGLSRE